MNRARTEAMLSGCCVVQVEGAHDIERFAIPNKNMIIVPNDPEKIAKLINNHYNDCIKIGQEGKKTAIKIFSREKYRQEWLKLIKSIIV